MLKLFQFLTGKEVNMYSDYHVHSRFSFDSDESPDTIIKRASKLHMSQICFTDHQDYNWPVEGEAPLLDMEEYISTLAWLREKYSHSIQVLTGIELGLMKGNESLCSNLLNLYHFDFVIGSCHIVDGMDPYYSNFWGNRRDRDAFELYFNTLINALKTFNTIDTLGHLDYIVRYSPNKDKNYSFFDYQDIIDEILKFIIGRNIKLEINTSNLAKGFHFPNPHTDIIKRYRELGGEYVTVGSDAHKAEYIGFGFDTVEEIIRKLNLKVFTIKE